MANTFELIASSTVGSGGASSIDFTSIPSTYTDLVLKISGRGSRTEITSNWLVSFNSSTTNFSAKYLEGTGSSAVSGSYARFIGAVPASTATASTFGNTEMYIPNYASSNNKSYSVDEITENNATGAEQDLIAGLWSNTAAITSISITSGSSDSIAQYSTAYLYGIKSS